VSSGFGAPGLLGAPALAGSEALFWLVVCVLVLAGLFLVRRL